MAKCLTASDPGHPLYQGKEKEEVDNDVWEASTERVLGLRTLFIEKQFAGFGSWLNLNCSAGTSQKLDKSH